MNTASLLQFIFVHFNIRRPALRERYTDDRAIDTSHIISLREKKQELKEQENFTIKYSWDLLQFVHLGYFIYANVHLMG